MNFETFFNGLIQEARERGFAWAGSSASLEISEDERQMLEDIGRSIAQRAACTRFDPSANIEDWHAADEHQKTVRDLADAEMAEVHAAHAVREREDERARLGADASPPQLPPWMTTGGAVLFALFFCISIFDWIHERLDDAYVAAVAALVPSIALGIFVVRALTSLESPAERRVGFIAGLGLAVATGVLRFAFAPDEWLLSIALTALETALVLFLDWHGGGLQARYREWRTEHEARVAAGQLLDAARDQHRRAVEYVAELAEKSAAHLREVARRSLLSEKAAEIETAVVNAIVAGAHSGCAQNQGLRRGVSRATFREAVQ